MLEPLQVSDYILYPYCIKFRLTSSILTSWIYVKEYVLLKLILRMNEKKKPTISRKKTFKKVLRRKPLFL